MLCEIEAQGCQEVCRKSKCTISVGGKGECVVAKSNLFFNFNKKVLTIVLITTAYVVSTNSTVLNLNVC